jgi:hypothetical protein
VLHRPSRLCASLLAVLFIVAATGCSSGDPNEYPSKALENFKTACIEANNQGSNRLSGTDLTTYCGIPDQNDNQLVSDKNKDGCLLNELRTKYPKFSDFKANDSKLRTALKSGEKTREQLAADPEFKDFIAVSDACTTKGP